MIDLHSHILPGIDDGAKTIEDPVEMARIAVDQWYDSHCSYSSCDRGTMAAGVVDY